MTEHRDLAREPCPDRIVEDLGGAFGMGCIGGFFWNFAKGWHHSPKSEKLAGAFYSSRMRAPVLGGSFAVWGGLFGTFDCSFQYLRGKDDAWNAIASGAMTGGLLSIRAVVGGCLLAIIEGVVVLFNRRTATPRDDYYQMKKHEEQLQLPTARRCSYRVDIEPQRSYASKCISVTVASRIWGAFLQAAAQKSTSSWFPSLIRPDPGKVSSPSPSSPFDDPTSALSSAAGELLSESSSPTLSFPTFSSEYAPAASESVKRRWRGFA